MSTKNNIVDTGLLEIAEAQIQVSYTAPSKKIVINTGEKAYKFLMKVWDKSLIELQEQFYVLFLDNHLQLKSWRLLNTGTSTHCLIDVKLLCSLAIKSMADNVIIAHNHPSGSLKVSEPDIQMTRSIKEKLYFLDIKLIDSLIITKKDYSCIDFECL